MTFSAGFSRVALSTILFVASSSVAMGQGRADPNAGQGQTHATASLTSLSPATLNQSTTALTVSVRGTGFSDKSQVRVDGTPRSTAFVSETELRVTLLAADVASAGSRSVSVFNPGGGTSNALPLAIAAVAAAPPAPQPVDNVAPHFQPSVLPDLRLTATSASGAVATLVAPVAVDNSGNVTVTATPYAIGVPVTFSVGTSTVTYRATDPSGNFATATQRIIVAALPAAAPPPPATDTQPPTFAATSLQPIHVIATNVQGRVITLVMPQANDNSGSVTVKASFGTFSIEGPHLFPIGTTPVLFTATDPSGNESTLSQSVIVDPPPPAVLVAGLDPENAVSGAPPFLLIVRGSGFRQGMEIRWNDKSRQTTLIDEHRLAANISSSDLASPGTATVTVYDPLTHQEAAAKTFVINASAPEAPRITAVNPATVIAVSGSSISVYGTGFVPGSVVRYSSVDNPRPETTIGALTRFNSSTALLASVPEPLRGYPGVYAVKVDNGASGGESNAVTLTLATPPRKATRLMLASPASQTGVPGQNVSAPPAVIVRDQYDSALPGVTVNFSVSSGGGAITPASAVSDANGVARTTAWLLGPNAGLNYAVAAASGVQSVSFTGRGEAPVSVAQSLQPLTAASLTGSAGGAVSQPPAVIVNDQNGKALAGVTVTFIVTAGNGAVSPQIQTTGADGIARATTWTLGPNVGVNQVKAYIPNTTLATTFTANVPYTMVALIKAADGSQLQNAQVCVGSRSTIDQYAKVKDAGTFGRQTFTVDAVPEYGVTASKGGYAGRTVFFNPTGNSGAVTVTLAPGSGGPVCPGAVTSVDATVAIPLTTTTTAAPTTATPGTGPTYYAAAPKYGEQILSLHGRGNGLQIKQLDCGPLGKGTMMSGIGGYYGLAVDLVRVDCASLVSVNALRAAGNAGSIGERNSASDYERPCDASGTGEAIVGISGTVKNGDIRSLAIHCQHLGANGLATGPIRKLASVGTVEGTAFGPDMCTKGRVARALWATKANITLNLPGSNLGIITPYNAVVVTGVKLICDDSSRP